MGNHVQESYQAEKSHLYNNLNNFGNCNQILETQKPNLQYWVPNVINEMKRRTGDAVISSGKLVGPHSKCPLGYIWYLKYKTGPCSSIFKGNKTRDTLETQGAPDTLRIAKELQGF